MLELEDKEDLNTSAERRPGANPGGPTNYRKRKSKMRFSILADKNGRPIINSANYHDVAAQILLDRIANNESFPGEKF